MNTDLENQTQENLQAIKQLTLMDDVFMTQVFSENKAATEAILKIILDRNDLKVLQAVTQLAIANLGNKSVRLDIYARDANDKQYDIEIQQNDAGAIPERARLNSSLFDAKLTHIGQKYEEIPETYVIFITENDVLGSGYPLYNIERTIQQNHKLFNDKAHIIYVNGSYRGDDSIGNLMTDFHCSDYTNIKNKDLANAVKYYKENPKGVSKMSKILDELAEKRIYQSKIDSALEMLADEQLPLEKIAKYSKLPIEKIQELAANRKIA